MSTAATPIGATAPQVSYAMRRIGRQSLTRFAWDDCARREAKHLAAVANTLPWADESAEPGDHFDALAWLEPVEAIGDERRSEPAVSSGPSDSGSPSAGAVTQ
jgi:hypothetical protein